MTKTTTKRPKKRAAKTRSTPKRHPARRPTDEFVTFRGDDGKEITFRGDWTVEDLTTMQIEVAIVDQSEPLKEGEMRCVEWSGREGKK